MIKKDRLKNKQKCNLLVPLLYIILLISCAQEKAEDPSTDLKEASVIDQVVIGYEGLGSNLGEFLINDPTVKIPLRIINRGEFEIRNISVDFRQESLYFTYLPTEVGAKAFPGKQGSCQSTLLPGQSCLIYLAFHPQRSGEYIYNFSITYMSASKRKVVRPMSLRARTGFPALLIISQGETFQDWGVIEQTEPKDYINHYTLTNTGELSAKNLNFSLNVSGGSSAFEVINNTCLTDIPPEGRCTYSIRHHPLNNQASDPTVSYNAQGSITYEKDNAQRLGGVTFQVVSLSTLIQGIFKAAGNNKIIFSPNRINGTRETQVFKIKNDGFRSGMPLEFIFKRADQSFWASCKKTLNGIQCFDQDDSELTLAQFPFRLTDLDSCLDKVIEGRSKEAAGGSCFFNLTYQPSVTRSAGVDDTGTIISLKYDSLWKGQTTIKTKDLFTIEANSVTPAKLELQRMRLDGQNLSITSINNYLPQVNHFYLGRLPKVTSANYPFSVQYSIKNNGDSPASLVHFKDGQDNLLTNTPTQLNQYYREVVTSGCDLILPGQSCNLQFKLTTLVDQNGGTAAEIQALNDTYPANPADCTNYLNNPSALLENCYKSFTITYQNSAQYNDDGSAMSNQNLHMRLSADLVAKAFLVYHEDSGVMDDLTGGETSTHYVRIDNIGTGNATYLRLRPNFDLKDPSNTDTGWKYGLTVVDQSHNNDGSTEIANTGANYDCYALTDWDSSRYYQPAPGTFVANQVLPAFHSCVYKVEFAQHPGDRDTYYEFAQGSPIGFPAEQFRPEHLRFFQYQSNGSMNMWEWKERSLSHNLRLEYADGDTLDPAPDSSLFGNFTVLDDYTLSQNWKSPTAIIPAGTSPDYAGFITREAINLPALNLPNYLWQDTNSNETWAWKNFAQNTNIPYQVFNNTHFHPNKYESVFSASADDLALNFKNRAPYQDEFDAAHDYHIQLGTIPSNLPYAVNLKFFLTANKGHPAKLESFNYQADSSQMVFTSNPYFPMEIGLNVFRPFNFTLPIGATPGLEHGSVEYSFSSREKTETVSMQVMAQVVDVNSIPQVKLSFGDYTVNYDPEGETTTVEPFDENEDYTSLNRSLSFIQYHAATSHMEELVAVKSDDVYALKRIKISNPSSHQVTGLHIYLDQYEISVANPDPLPSGLSIENNQCLGDSLEIGGSCTFDLKYKPNSSANTQFYDLSFYHHIKDEQTTVQVAKLKLTPVSPAKIEMEDLSEEHFDNNLPTTDTQPYPTTAYVWDTGDYNPLAKSHIILNSYPTIVESNPIQLINESTKKASLLKMIPKSQWKDITFDGGYTLLYDGRENKNIQVYATRPCLVGNWSGDFTQTEELVGEGFNHTTNACQIKLQYHADEDVIGDNLNPEDLVITLLYFDNDHSSYSDELNFTVRGFVEAPPSTTTNGGKMVSVSMDRGEIGIEWPTFTTSGDEKWGEITGYRIYWDNNNSGLNYTDKGIFQDDTFTNYTEVSATTYHLMQNYPVNRFYSFMVLPIRTIQDSSQTYLSASDLEVPILLSPADNQYYDFENFALIETSIQGDNVNNTKEEAEEACASQSFTIFFNNSPKFYPKTLITSEDWNLIKNEEDLNRSRYGGDVYPDMFTQWPHWIHSPTEDAHDVFGPLGWNGSSLEYLDGASNTKLKLDPNDPDQREINLLQGGLFEQPRTHWVHPNHSLGFVRCRAEVNPYSE